MRALAIICALTLGAAVWAEAPDASLRPVLRAGSDAVAYPPPKLIPIPPGMTPGQAAAAASGGAAVGTVTITPAPVETPVADTTERRGLFRSLRPQQRDRGVERQAEQSRAERRRGSVCGDLDLQGSVVGRVPGAISGCGVDNAVKLTSVSGVRLSTPATVDCPTAKALKRWVEKGVEPAVGRHGGGVAELRVFASYACRTRNNQKGARISEHGRGRAIDIGGLTLRDGQQISVLRDWGNGKEGRMLRKMHRAACGPFGTVLGPEADRFHRDHFHFDTARYRSGSYCK